MPPGPPMNGPMMGGPMPDLRGAIPEIVTVYVEGLPSHIDKREVAHIFRPLPGYTSLRIKPSTTRNRMLCFVEFSSREAAENAIVSRQAYLVDEDDPELGQLHLSFANQQTKVLR